MYIDDGRSARGPSPEPQPQPEAFSLAGLVQMAAMLANVQNPNRTLAEGIDSLHTIIGKSLLSFRTNPIQ